MGLTASPAAADDQNTRWRWRWLALTILVLLLVYANWPSPVAKVAGRVEVVYGPRARDIEITVQGPDGPVTRAFGVAADGTFTGDGLPPGSFELRVRRGQRHYASLRLA